MVTVSDVGLDVRSEGVMWGMQRKRTLFGPEGQDSVSSVSDVVEAQSGWPQTTNLRKKPGLRGWTLPTWWSASRRKWRISE